MFGLPCRSAWVIVAHGASCVHVPVSLPPCATHATLTSVPHVPSGRHAPGAPHSAWAAQARHASLVVSHTGVAAGQVVECVVSHATHSCFPRSHTGAAALVHSASDWQPCGPSLPPLPSSKLQLCSGAFAQ